MSLDNEVLGQLLFTVAMVGIGLVGAVVVADLIRDHRRRRSEPLLDPSEWAPDITGKPTAAFCPDCGGRAVVWQNTNGFHTTGLPRKNRVLACVDWGTIAARLGGPLPGGLSPEGRLVFGCGNVASTPYMPLVTHTHDGAIVELTCVRCLIEMERMGVLTREEAQEKLDALGPNDDLVVADDVPDFGSPYVPAAAAKRKR